MNFKKAVSIIKDRSRRKVLAVDWKNKKIFLDGFYGEPQEHNARETIAFARAFTSDYSFRESEMVKKLSHKKDRAKTRDLINKKDFEQIPNNKPVDAENPWNWD